MFTSYFLELWLCYLTWQERLTWKREVPHPPRPPSMWPLNCLDLLTARWLAQHGGWTPGGRKWVVNAWAWKFQNTTSAAFSWSKWSQGQSNSRGGKLHSPSWRELLQNPTAKSTGMVAIARNSLHSGLLSLLTRALMDGHFIILCLLSSRVPAVCRPLC